MRALWSSSRVVFAPVLLAVILAYGKGSYALSTAFTFQGQLRLNDAPASGTCDLEFQLFDALSGGGQIGTTQAVSSVEVNEGRFTVQLDFGPSAFAGDDRWLDIAVRCPAGAGAFTTLAPRQPITPAPYALYARESASASWSGLQGVPAGFGDGVDDDTTYTAGSGLQLSASQFSADMNVVQSRVAAACPPGSSIRAVNADGTVQCENDDNSGGDITGVTAGAGLTGGAQSGNATLNVSFGGPGTASSAARSDHDHFGETWIGSGAGLRVITGTGAPLRGEEAGGGAGGGIPTVGLWGETSAGVGVLGITDLGNGVSGQSNDPFFGGVAGENGNGGMGVTGWSAGGIGVFGSSDVDRGVLGESSSASGSGVEGSNLLDGIGVKGHSNAGFGGFFDSGSDHLDLALGGAVGRINTDPADNHSTLILSSNADVIVRLDNDSGENGVFRIKNSGGTSVCTVDESGNLTCTGNKSAVMRTESYGWRKLYAVESPEVWFEDFGSASLNEGEAQVQFEPIFAQTIDRDSSYHVFLTPLCDEPVLLFVTDKTAAGFTVRGVRLDQTPSACGFDYRVVAKRAGYGEERLAQAER